MPQQRWSRLAVLGGYFARRLWFGIRNRVAPPRRPAQLRTAKRVVARIAALSDDLWAAAALQVAWDAGLIEALRQPVGPSELAGRTGLPPQIVEAVLDVLAGLGLVVRRGDRFRPAEGLRRLMEDDGAASCRAELAATLLQSADFVDRASWRRLDLDGWRHDDPRIIRLQGDLTVGLTERAIPMLAFLPGLVGRLEAPGARLLDVGAGAGGLSIALCRRFPHLAADALEPADAPFAIGVRQVEAAGLDARIRFRKQRIEDVTDPQAFDLVFLPQMFLPDDVVATALARVFDALRPGGWALVVASAEPGPDLRSALSRLQSLLWGGNIRSRDVVRSLVARAGFDPVIAPAEAGRFGVICARRAPE